MIDNIRIIEFIVSYLNNLYLNDNYPYLEYYNMYIEYLKILLTIDNETDEIFDLVSNEKLLIDEILILSNSNNIMLYYITIIEPKIISDTAIIAYNTAIFVQDY